jgi:hypothetical protein
LAAALAALPRPAQEWTQAQWQDYEKSLRAVALKYRDIGHKWELNDEQYERMAQYLQASQLLVDCLQVAYVTDREAIENGLLLPPG